MELDDDGRKEHFGIPRDRYSDMSSGYRPDDSNDLVAILSAAIFVTVAVGRQDELERIIKYANKREGRYP